MYLWLMCICSVFSYHKHCSDVYLICPKAGAQGIYFFHNYLLLNCASSYLFSKEDVYFVGVRMLTYNSDVYMLVPLSEYVYLKLVFFLS